MMWLDDESGDLVNVQGARTIGVRELDEGGPDDPTHAVMVIWDENTSASLFSGSESACIEFRNGLRSALKRADSSKPEIEYVFPEMRRG